MNKKAFLKVLKKAEMNGLAFISKEDCEDVVKFIKDICIKTKYSVYGFTWNPKSDGGILYAGNEKALEYFKEEKVRINDIIKTIKMGIKKDKSK